MKNMVYTLLLILVSITVSAQKTDTAFPFLRLPVSAHAAALGGDNTSIIEDDITLIWCNPALLCNVNNHSLALTYDNQLQNTHHLGAAFNKTIKDRAAIAFSGQYVGYGQMKEVNESNEQLGTFSAKDMVISGYFCYMLTDRLSGGITAKWIMSYIGDYHSMAAAVDLGINYYLEEQDLSLSATLRNLGGQLTTYHDVYERMPFDMQVGVSKRLSHTPLRFSATLKDLIHWDYPMIRHLCLGADVLLSQAVWVAIGYDFGRAHDMTITTQDSASNHGAGFTLGAGIQLQGFKLQLGYGKYHISGSSFIANIGYSL